MRALALAISLALISLNSIASDSDRISQLEKEVQELKLRLTNLEAPQGNTSNRQKSLSTSDGWKTLANWRSLKKGISYDEVRATLGEPDKVRASGPLTFWYYLNRGDVKFYENRLDGWTEPR